MIAEGKYLSYKRYDKKEQILVIFNLEDDIKEVELPHDVTYLNLLDEKRTIKDTIILEPLSAVILKKI